MMAQSRAESTRDTYNYGQYLNQFPPNTIKVIREFERIQKKICRYKMFIMFNEICINEEMLPKYTYIYMCVCVCVCVRVYVCVSSLSLLSLYFSVCLCLCLSVCLGLSLYIYIYTYKRFMVLTSSIGELMEDQIFQYS